MLDVIAPVVALAPILLGIAAEAWRWWRHDWDRDLRRLTRQHHRRTER